MLALAEDVPSLFLTLEQALDERLRAYADLTAAKAIDRAREHAEAATAAGQTVAIEVARTHAEAAVAATQAVVLDSARQHAEALSRQLGDEVESKIAVLRREFGVARRIEHSTPVSGESAKLETAAAPRGVDPALYVALEDTFRGAPEVIAERQRVYLPLVDHLGRSGIPVLDLGCGRGEWLKLLAEAEITAIGVDSNPAFVAENSDAGISVVQGDLVGYLRSAPSASVGAVTMFQVVEHLPFPVLVEVISECARVLSPGGVLIAETPNALNLQVAATTFWLDPTHERPLHPELLKFVAKQVGFAKVDGWFLNDLQATGHPENSPVVDRLVDLVDGPGDFALLAWT